MTIVFSLSVLEGEEDEMMEELVTGGV